MGSEDQAENFDVAEQPDQIELEASTDSPEQAELRTLEGLLRKLPAVRREVDPECERIVALVEQIGLRPQSESSEASGCESLPSLDLQQLGQYKLLAKLGEGGMGAVYKARHTRLNKLVALKLLSSSRMQDAAAVARFDREMRAVGALDHENIVAAHDAGEIDGTHYLAMELVQGVDVGAVLKQQTTLRIADACEIIRQAAEGLQHAYESNLVHRDIKPSNLMLAAGSKDVQVKILDMGLALLDEPQADSDLTAAGQIMGTLDYMAPEQAGDTHTVDIRADIYSLGATLYKLLTGQVPFEGPQYAGTIKKLTALATQDPPRIDSLRDDLPAELVEIVQRMLARKPEDRYPTPRELAEAIAPFAAGANLAALLEAAAPLEQDAERTALLHSSAKAGESVSVRSSVVDTQSQVVVPGRKQPASSSELSGQHGAQPANPATGGIGHPPSRRRNVLLACAAVPLAIVLGVVLLSLRTPHGEVVVELADGIPAEAAKDLKIEVSGAGGLKVADAVAGWTIDIAEGRYQAKLVGGSDRFELEQNQITVTRKEKTLLKVTLKPAGRTPPAGEQTTKNGAPLSEIAEPLPPTFTNSIGMEFVLVPRGEFRMGGGGGTPGKERVEISHDFYIGKYEVTQEEWEKVTGRNPSIFSRTGSKSESVEGISDEDLKRFPVEMVSWTDAQLFVETLNNREPKSGWEYRLPTEAEWEYACRGGPDANLFRYSWNYYREEPTNELLPDQANFNMSLLRTCKVGSYAPNRLGLYDMHGNVFEWCQDIFADKLIGGRDPLVSSGGTGRVLRGGSWYDAASGCRSASRLRYDPSVRRGLLGLRVVRVPLAGRGANPRSEASRTGSSPAAPPATTAQPTSSWQPTPEQQAFFDQVAGLPADEQAAAVAKKLMEVNPGFDGKYTHKVAFGQVSEFAWTSDDIAAIWPVRALTDLVSLRCAGSPGGSGGKLRDLSVLRGMQLTKLDVQYTSVSDLGPLKGLPLRQLHCQGTPVSDLSPLQGMPLTSLSCGGSGISDLSPLAGMPLTYLAVGNSPVVDLSPLQGLPLTYLAITGTRVSDLAPLQRMPLAQLSLVSTQVSDLAPLRGLPLTFLHLQGTPVTDLSPLQGMPLTELVCSVRVTDLSPLRGMAFKKIRNIVAVADLSPLQEMPLTHIQFRLPLYDETAARLMRTLPLQHISESGLSYLPAADYWAKLAQRRQAAEAFAAATAALPVAEQVAAVEGKLAELNGAGKVGLGPTMEEGNVVAAKLSLSASTLADVTPVMAFTHLKQLSITGGRYYQDISCVKFLPLEELICSEDIAFKNQNALRELATLNTINGQPAQEYLENLRLKPPTVTAEDDQQPPPAEDEAALGDAPPAAEE